MRLPMLILVTLSAAALAGAGQCADQATNRPLFKIGLVTASHRAALDLSHFDGSAIERPMDSRTAVDHRFGADGPVASAGYLCGIGGIGPDGEDAQVGPASAFQHFGTFLGASLALPIR